MTETNEPREGDGQQPFYVPGQTDEERGERLFSGDPETEEVPEEKWTDRPVVAGIGSSAGGLEAMSAFFDALPPDTGLTFVVSHLSPDHPSVLDELLQRHTAMPVLQVREDRVSIQPDHVYVIPPNRQLVLTDAHLQAAEFEGPRAGRAPIDSFFRSLAAMHATPVGILLSGGGSDGALGLRSIKEAGGLVMVQDPQEAAHNSMPNSAIATGVVDLVLTARGLAQKLVEVNRRRAPVPRDPMRLSPEQQDTLQRILTQLNTRTGQDFRAYKQSTILRRIQRRMQIAGYETLEGYLPFLRQSSDETQALLGDLLIGVTNFFRDDERARQLLDLALGAARVGWSTLDLATGRAEHDVRARELLGFAPDEDLTVAGWLERVHLDDRDRVEETIQNSRNSGELMDLEYRIVLSDGEVRHIRGTGTIVGDENGRPMWTGLVSDITEQRRSEAALREAREHLELALRSAALGWGVSDVRSGRLIQDARARAIAGFAPDQPLTLADYLALVHPDDRPRVQADYEARISTDYGEPLEYRITRPDGQERIIRGTGLVRRDASGEPWQIAGTLKDVTEQRETEAALRRLTESLEQAVARRTEELQEANSLLSRAHERFRILFQANPVPTVLYRLSDGVALDANPAFLEYNNLKRDDVVGQKAGALRQLLDVESSLEMVESALAGGRRHAFEREVRHPSGEMRTLLVSIAPIELDGERCLLGTHIDITERKQMERELRQRGDELEATNAELAAAGERFRVLFHTSPTPTFIMDPAAGVYLDANPAFLDFIGLAREAVIGHRPHDIVQELPTYKNQATLTREFAATGLLHDLETEFALRSGERRTTLTSYARMTLEGRELLLATLTDITGRKAAEQRIRDQQSELARANAELTTARDRFSAIFAANPTPSMIFSLETGLYVNVNPAFVAYTGLAPEDVVGHRPEEFARAGDPEREAELAAIIMRDGRVRDFETSFTNAAGERRTVLAAVEPVTIDGQSCQVTTLTDITERKEAERKVREQQRALETANAELTAARDRFQTLFHANPVPSAMIDLEDMVYLDVNHAYLDFYGLEPEQIVGRSLVNPEQWPDEEARRRVVDDYRRRGRFRNDEMVVKLPTGESRTVLASDTPFELDGRRCTLATFIDITERKRAEERVRELASQLTLVEQDERQRISAILHDDLQQRLFALQIQLDTLNVRAQKGQLDAIPASVERMHDALAQLLEATRRLSVDLSPPILRGEGLYHTLLWLASQMKEQYGLTVSVEKPAHWRRLDQGLRIALFQITRELLFNVVKHAKVDRVTVTLAQTEEGAVVEVRDAGVGFDVAAIRDEAAGQGLRQAQRRVELYGGRLRIASQPESGTLVTITVPTTGLLEAQE